MLKRLGFFVMTMGISLGVTLTLAVGLKELLPIRGAFYAWAAVTIAVIVTIIVFLLRLFIDWLNEGGALILSALASLIFTAFAFVGYYIVEPLFTDPPTTPDITELEERITVLENKIDAIEDDLIGFGLTIQQIRNLQEMYVSTGYLDVNDVAQLGLNQTQLEQVRALIISEGLTIPDASIVATEQAIMVTEQAIMAQATEAATCYARPTYRAVNVRITPEERDDNFLTFLLQREQVRVIGHSGGTINTTRWWYIELPNETEEDRKKGWVASNMVEEINLTACNTLPQYK